MDKNENFKNVLNNLKNLSGGKEKSDKNQGSKEIISEQNTLNITIPQMNETKPIPGSFIGCISFLGIFNFLNPFFYILKYTVMEKKGDLDTWISIHAVIYVGAIITFFIFLFYVMISNVSTKELDTDISNVKLFRVFFSIIFLLLFATTIMLSISESCNSTVTLEEEEEMYTGNYDIKEICENVKDMDEGKGKTYISTLLGMFTIQAVMCLALLSNTISSDDILKKLNVYPIKLDKDKASKIINNQFKDGLKIRIDDINNKLDFYLDNQFKNQYDDYKQTQNQQEEIKQKNYDLKDSLDKFKELKEYLEGEIKDGGQKYNQFKKEKILDDDILLINFLNIDNLNDFNLKNVDENYVIFKLKKDDHLLFDKNKKINILLTEDTTVGIKFFKSDIKFDIDDDIKPIENTEEDIEKNNKTKTSVGEDLIVVNNSFIFRYEEKSRLPSKFKPSFYVYTTITLDDNLKIKSSKHRYEVKANDKKGQFYLDNVYKFRRIESTKECMINGDPTQRIK